MELLLRLRRAADHPNDGLAEIAAAVSIAEVGGILEIFEAWRSDPAWPEFQQVVQDPHNYLHAVTTLRVASALKQHHPKTELVASSTPGPSADLRMVVSDEHGLAVEVKTSLSLGQRSWSMSASEAVDFINGAIKDASGGFRRQLEKGQPGVLVVGGFHIDRGTLDAPGDAAGQVLALWSQRTHLLAIVVSHTRFAAPTVVNRRVLVGLAHETRIKSNPRYAGNLRLTGEWAGEWHLQSTGGGSAS